MKISPVKCAIYSSKSTIFPSVSKVVHCTDVPLARLNDAFFFVSCVQTTTMDVLQAFIFDNASHVVCVLRDEDDNPLFKADDMGKVLSIQNVRTSITDFDEEEKVVRTFDSSGGAQETTFLTEQGALKLIMRSRKPIAKPFQKWVFNVIKTISREGKYELEKEIALAKREGEEERKKSEQLFRQYKDAEDERVHKTLVEGIANRNAVYFGKIKTMEDDRILFKIGCTKNIRPRRTGLKMEFGNMSIFNVFECDNHDEFENYLHKHENIRRYGYRELINGKKRSHEVFCMTETEVKRAVNIAIHNVSQFRVNNKRDIDDLVNTNPTVRALCDKVGLPVHEDVDSMEIGYTNKRGRCTLTGPKIQAYSEDGRVLVQTYQTLLDAVRDMIAEGEGASQPAIDRACEKKTVKFGYRWAKLERSKDDSTVQNIGETMEENAIRTGLVAALCDDRSEVVKIYTSYKACGLENGFKSAGAVQKVANRCGKVGGHYIVPWSDVDEAMQDKWLQNNTLPKLKRNATCIKVSRLDPITRKVLRTYDTMNSVKTHFKIGQRALKSAIAGDLVRKGFKWSYAEN